MRTAWGACFRVLWPQAREEALKTWGYDTPHAAMEAGNMEALRFLLDHQASVSQRVNGETALQVAIRKRNFEALRLVATCDSSTKVNTAHFNARDSNGDTFLAVAARDGDLELASVLLEVGARTEFMNKSGYSAIMWSAVTGNVAMTRLLLEHGASPNVSPRAWKKHWKSPLSEAVVGGNLEVVKMLVEAGANLYLKDAQWHSILDLAQSLRDSPLSREAGPFPRKSLRSLQGTDPSGRATWGHMATASPEVCAQANAIAEYLRNKFSAIEDPDDHGETPLFRAIKNDDLEEARSLLGRGANVAARDKYERTALLCAAMNKNLRMVKLLISHKIASSASAVDIDAHDHRGKTSLLYAARNGDFEMVKLLVANGANLNTHNNIKNGAHIVVRIKRKNVLLVTNYRRSARVETSIEVGFTALTYAAKRGHTEIVKFLIGKGADVDAKDCYDRTVLMHALAGNNCKLEIIKLLVEHGADINARSMDGSSAIHFAAVRGQTPVIDYLLEHGADVDDMNYLCWTPLMQLSRRGAISSVRLLIKKGAEVDWQEEFGRTALFFAVKSGRIHVVRYLLERGAKANVMDEYKRKTALDVAREAGREDIVELLIAHGAKG